MNWSPIIFLFSSYHVRMTLEYNGLMMIAGTYQPLTTAGTASKGFNTKGFCLPDDRYTPGSQLFVVIKEFQFDLIIQIKIH